MLTSKITEDEFIELFDSLLPEFNCFLFVPPNWEYGINATTRAFINFEHLEDSMEFVETFNGRVFVDMKGVAIPVTIQFVPFQALPINRIIKPIQTNPLSDIDVDFMELLEKLRIENMGK